MDWDQPPEEKLNGILRQYKINITEDITGKRLQFITGPYPTEITVGPLHPDYTYHCTVVAYTVGEGPHTSILPIRTKEDGESGIVITLTHHSLKFGFGIFIIFK